MASIELDFAAARVNDKWRLTPEVFNFEADRFVAVGAAEILGNLCFHLLVEGLCLLLFLDESSFARPSCRSTKGFLEFCVNNVSEAFEYRICLSESVSFN